MLICSCPTCGNMLVVSRATGENKFECQSCPYEYPIYRNVRQLTEDWSTSFLAATSNITAELTHKTGESLQQYTDRTVLSRKEVDDVLGGEEAWKNVDQTEGEFNTLSLTQLLGLLTSRTWLTVSLPRMNSSMPEMRE